MYKTGETDYISTRGFLALPKPKSNYMQSILQENKRGAAEEVVRI